MTASEPIRIGVVEDDERLCAYYAATIAGSGDMTLAFRAGTLAIARARLRETQPHLCLVDLGLPDGSGVDFVRAIKAQGDGKALVLTVLGDRKTVMTALKAGADGYVLKSMAQEELLTHIRQTLDGFTPVSPQVATYLLELLSPAKAAIETERALTSRETEVLSVFARGLTYDETARALNISANTVRDYVKKIYAKLDVHSRSEALFEAQAMGLIARERPNDPA